MEKDFEYIELFELYKDLLTEKQRELFSSHLLLDLSLAEVAENEKSSRQSVYDAVKKVKIKLVEYENALHLKSKYDEIKKLSSDNHSELLKQVLDIIGK